MCIINFCNAKHKISSRSCLSFFLMAIAFVSSESFDCIRFCGNVASNIIEHDVLYYDSTPSGRDGLLKDIKKAGDPTRMHFSFFIYPISFEQLCPKNLISAVCVRHISCNTKIKKFHRII